MSELIEVFKIAFGALNSAKVLGIPVLFWFIMASVLGIIVSFIKGKKE